MPPTRLRNLFLLCAAGWAAATAPMLINVVDHGADPSGQADSTAAFRASLEVSGAQSAVPVAVPPGVYRISGTLNVTLQTLLGSTAGAWVSDGSPQPRIRFDPFGEVREGSALIRLGGGGAVHGLHIEYDWGNQSVQSVPPCIHLETGDGQRVSDTRITGAWEAVSSLGNPNAGRYLLANLFIVDAHHYGVAMGPSFDFSTIDGVEVWAPNSPFMFANGTGILISAVDGVRASNLAVFRASVGLSLQSDLPGSPTHGVWGTFTNVITDYCVVGMVVNGSNTVQLSSGSFQSHETSLDVQGAGGTIRVSGSRFKSNGDSAVRISGSNIVTISGSGLSRVFPPVLNRPALEIGSNATQTVTISGCDLESSDAVAIQCAGASLSPGVMPVMCASDSAMLSGNFLRTSRNTSAVTALRPHKRARGYGGAK